MTVTESSQQPGPPAGPLPPRPGAWRPPTPAAGAGRRPRLSLGRALLRAFDPRLTAKIRVERAQFTALSTKLRVGSSIAVIGLAPGSGRSTVTALLSLALAQHHTPRILAIDAGEGGGLYRRLARWPDGSAHEVLVGLGIRGTDGQDPRPSSVGYRWLRQRLALADEVLLLAGDPALREAPLSTEEYPAVLRTLGRWFSAVITDTPRLSNESIVPAAVSQAERIVVVGPADDQGVHWVTTCLPWIESVSGGPAAERTVGVLVQQRDPGAERSSPPLTEAGVPLFTVPYDRHLAQPAPVSWDALSPAVTGAVNALAARVVTGLHAE
jgi:MinD-like ATPase involved in chromosome partitioning or flagellar assembly